MTEEKHTPESFENIISRFKNGYERFKTSVTFNRIVNCLVRGYDHYQLIDELVELSDKSALHIQEIYQNQKPAPMMISKDVADQLLLSRVSDLEKENEDLKLRLSGKTFFDEKEVMQQRIDGLEKANAELLARKDALEEWLTEYRDELKKTNVFHKNEALINEINGLIEPQ